MCDNTMLIVIVNIIILSTFFISFQMCNQAPLCPMSALTRLLCSFCLRSTRPPQIEKENVVTENQPEVDVQQLPPSLLSTQQDGPENQKSTYTGLQGRVQESENAYENDTELGYEVLPSPDQGMEYEYVNPSRVM